MSLTEYQVAKLGTFGGAWTRVDPPKVPLIHALRAWNAEFGPGEVRTRKGFGPVTIAYNIRSMYNVVTSSGNALVFFGSASSLESLSLFVAPLLAGTASPVVTSLGAVPGIGGVFAPAGNYLMFAPYTAAIGGYLGLHAYAIAPFGAPAVTAFADKAFQGPLSTKPTLGTTGAGGVVTAGVHRVGYLIQSRTGFSGRISPVTATAAPEPFDTTSVVTTTAGQKISFTITLTWPTGAALVYPVMATVDTPDRYFIVPGLSPVVVVGGVSSAVAWTIDISDADLATGTNITDNQNLIAQEYDGGATLSPFSVGAYGSRTVWLAENPDAVTGSEAYVSEPSQPQVFTWDQHVLRLPGNKQMRAQGVAGHTLYILGPHWTYAFEDEGQIPVLWPEPRLIDGSIGTSSPHGFTVDASTGVGWCAHISGLYFFSGGFFAPLPVSYYSDPDWKRINWATGEIAASTLPKSTPPVVIDDKERLRVVVLAGLNMQSTVNTVGTAVEITKGDTFPLSGVLNSGALVQQVTINGISYTLSSVTDATHGVLSTSAGTQTGVTLLMFPAYPTHLLVYDYSGGVDPNKIKYSRWEISGYVPGFIHIVQNPGLVANPTYQFTDRELWLGEWFKTANPRVRRQMGVSSDVFQYHDDTYAIDWQWEAPLLPGMELDLGAVYYHYAQQVRATGAGTLNRTLYGLDRTKSVALPAITLSTVPGQVYTNRFARLRSEGASTLFSTSAYQHNAVITGLEHFYGLGPRFRAP